MSNVSYFCRDWYPRCGSPIPNWPHVEDLEVPLQDQLFLAKWMRHDLRRVRRSFRSIVLDHVTIRRRRPKGSCLQPYTTLLITAWWDTDAESTWPKLVERIRQSLDAAGKQDMIIDLVDTDWNSRIRYKSALESEHPLDGALEGLYGARNTEFSRAIQVHCRELFGEQWSDSFLELTRLGYNPNAIENPVCALVIVPYYSKPTDWESLRDGLPAAFAVVGFAEVGVEFQYREY
ncbi:MAG: hypothetical protein M1821_009351 [Bathelium mastoideum]|nr:MAG: hypothetical protein M1821_009351 [Bathelium mastoideum]